MKLLEYLVISKIEEQKNSDVYKYARCMLKRSLIETPKGYTNSGPINVDFPLSDKDFDLVEVNNIISVSYEIHKDIKI